jgi:hypothetical protein
MGRYDPIYWLTGITTNCFAKVTPQENRVSRWIHDHLSSFLLQFEATNAYWTIRQPIVSVAIVFGVVKADLWTHWHCLNSSHCCLSLWQSHSIQFVLPSQHFSIGTFDSDGQASSWLCFWRASWGVVSTVCFEHWLLGAALLSPAANIILGRNPCLR